MKRAKSGVSRLQTMMGVSFSGMRFMMIIFTPGEKRRVMGGRHGASSEEAAADDGEMP